MMQSCDESLVEAFDLTICMQMICSSYHVLYLKGRTKLLENLSSELQTSVGQKEGRNAIRI